MGIILNFHTTLYFIKYVEDENSGALNLRNTKVVMYVYYANFCGDR